MKPEPPEEPASGRDRAPVDDEGAARFAQDVCFLRGKALFRLRAAAILLWEDQVLMVRNALNPYYYSVGGAVQLGETTEAAVRREVWEEVGLRLPILRLAAIHQNFFQEELLGAQAWHELAFYYLMDYRGEPLPERGSLSMTGSPETLHWLRLSTFREQPAYPLFFADLKRLLLSPSPVQIMSREG
ncbi:MAG: NUDIX hydrolase [Christensenellales bacterium]